MSWAAVVAAGAAAVANEQLGAVPLMILTWCRAVRRQKCPEQPPSSEVWEAAPIMEEQRRNLVGLIPPNLRPRVILRWGNASELLVSGLLDGGDEIAQHAAVIDSPLERGHVILFSMNPFWRGQPPEVTRSSSTRF
jgi:hypothetical protein